MRFTKDQFRTVRYHLQEAANNALLASWRGENEATVYTFHAEGTIESLKTVAKTLGYIFEPLPVTDKPGFDGRDDRSLGMRESDIT